MGNWGSKAWTGERDKYKDTGSSCPFFVSTLATPISRIYQSGPVACQFLVRWRIFYLQLRKDDIRLNLNFCWPQIKAFWLIKILYQYFTRLTQPAIPPGSVKWVVTHLFRLRKVTAGLVKSIMAYHRVYDYVLRADCLDTGIRSQRSLDYGYVYLFIIILTASVKFYLKCNSYEIWYRSCVDGRLIEIWLVTRSPGCAKFWDWSKSPRPPLNLALWFCPQAYYYNYPSGCLSKALLCKKFFLNILLKTARLCDIRLQNYGAVNVVPFLEHPAHGPNKWRHFQLFNILPRSRCGNKNDFLFEK